MNEIHINALLAIIGTALAFISIIATAVWTVAAVKSTTGLLADRLVYLTDGLSKELKHLADQIDRLEND